MERILVRSRLIHSLAYNDETMALHVWFRNGKHRIHNNISRKTADNLASAESPGFYYTYYLQERQFVRARAPIWLPRFAALAGALVLLLPT